MGSLRFHSPRHKLQPPRVYSRGAAGAADAGLQETLLLLSQLPIHLLRVGDCALAFPANEFHLVQGALLGEQLFPTVVGQLPKTPPENLEDE